MLMSLGGRKELYQLQYQRPLIDRSMQRPQQLHRVVVSVKDRAIFLYGIRPWTSRNFAAHRTSVMSMLTRIKSSDSASQKDGSSIKV